ncbi:MAG TPA: hypothetical protein PLN32_04595 [Methanoregulaceae archaeon]|nr:hypothetical protein [Methanoregulaceae archaeon]
MDEKDLLLLRLLEENSRLFFRILVGRPTPLFPVELVTINAAFFSYSLIRAVFHYDPH